MADTKNEIVPQTYVSTDEAALLQATFKNNEILLTIIRNLFYGFDISKADKALVKKTFADSPKLVDAVRRKIFPKFEMDVSSMPTGLICDYWLDMDKDILGAHPDAIAQRVNSKQQVFEMLSSAMDLLINPDGKKIDLSYNPKLLVNDPLQINLLARSLYIRTIGQGILIIKMVADREDKTPAQVAIAEKKNSSK